MNLRCYLYISKCLAYSDLYIIMAVWSDHFEEFIALNGLIDLEYFLKEFIGYYISNGITSSLSLRWRMLVRGDICFCVKNIL